MLATVSDKKLQHSSDNVTVDYFTTDVVSASDYYPFGMMMPGRKYSVANTNYRYGFNGQEKSTEINGSGNLYTAKFWEYDSRIGRRWNVDPKPAIGLSVYSCFENNPLLLADINGDKPTRKQAAAMADDVYNKESNKKLRGGWRRSEIKINGVDKDKLTDDNIGLKSAIYGKVNKKGEVTEYSYATAGTDFTSIEDWKNNIFQIPGLSEQYKQSTNNAGIISNALGNQELTFVGHSLGGGLAAANAMKTGRDAVTFNAASVTLFTRFMNALPYTPRIDAYIVKGEILDRLQSSLGIRANGTIHEIEFKKRWWNRTIDKALPYPSKKLKENVESLYYHTMGAVQQVLDDTYQ